MIYRLETMQLWPRMIHAARSLDPDLATVLEELLRKGGALQQAENGLLQLGPGQMDPGEYDQIRQTKFVPKSGRMATIRDHARARQHPWIPALTTAYVDLKPRCQKGEARLKEILQKGDHSHVPAVSAALQERYWQAMSLANALYRAGLPAYAAEASNWVTPATELYDEMRRSGIQFDLNGLWPWPVQTPDGWLWVVDKSTWEERPVAVELGRDRGTKTRLADEPVVTDWDLGDALAPLEAGQRREAG